VPFGRGGKRGKREALTFFQFVIELLQFGIGGSLSGLPCGCLLGKSLNIFLQHKVNMRISYFYFFKFADWVKWNFTNRAHSCFENSCAHDFVEWPVFGFVEVRKYLEIVWKMNKHYLNLCEFLCSLHESTVQRGVLALLARQAYLSIAQFLLEFRLLFGECCDLFPFLVHIST
jgi:hypothetical protein